MGPLNLRRNKFFVHW